MSLSLLYAIYVTIFILLIVPLISIGLQYQITSAVSPFIYVNGTLVLIAILTLISYVRRISPFRVLMLSLLISILGAGYNIYDQQKKYRSANMIEKEKILSIIILNSSAIIIELLLLLILVNKFKNMKQTESDLTQMGVKMAYKV
jgi:hypothetical protein